MLEHTEHGHELSQIQLQVSPLRLILAVPGTELFIVEFSFGTKRIHYSRLTSAESKGLIIEITQISIEHFGEPLNLSLFCAQNSNLV
jgi:hypothetical protein